MCAFDNPKQSLVLLSDSTVWRGCGGVMFVYSTYELPFICLYWYLHGVGFVLTYHFSRKAHHLNRGATLNLSVESPEK